MWLVIAVLTGGTSLTSLPIRFETEKPIWLDAYFVQNLLRKAEKDESIKVSSLITKPATAKGDNYASDMRRITVEFSRIRNGNRITETRSVIAKLTLHGGPWCEIVAKSGVFETEISMMVDPLPKMKQMLAGLSKTLLAARCLGFQYENPKYLIIEDLAPRGFRMAECRAGLDLDHSLLAIRNIAVFHATSVALAEKDPKITAYCVWYDKNLEDRDYVVAVYSEFFKTSTKALGKEVANWPDLSPRISEKILKLSEVIWEKNCEAVRFLKDDFNVLNHGDCHSNNMLFRYDDEQRSPVEQTFVDFQLSYYGSPAYDLLKFFATSTSVDVRMDNRDSLLHAYYDSLSSTMATLKCHTKAPSFDDLQDILRRRGFCEVFQSFIELAHALTDRSKVNDLDEIMASDGERDHPAYRGIIYRKTMTRVLPFFDGMGFLDS